MMRPRLTHTRQAPSMTRMTLRRATYRRYAFYGPVTGPERSMVRA